MKTLLISCLLFYAASSTTSAQNNPYNDVYPCKITPSMSFSIGPNSRNLYAGIDWAVYLTQDYNGKRENAKTTYVEIENYLFYNLKDNLNLGYQLCTFYTVHFDSFFSPTIGNAASIYKAKSEASQFTLSPQIGINFIGVFRLTGGYNYKLDKSFRGDGVTLQFSILWSITDDWVSSF